MALTVIQRPEEDLYLEDNPTAYDLPYFTSRWNAANLPLTYKISNTRFPINTEDVIEDILTVSNNAGFAELGLDAATYTFFAKGSVKITNTANYNGVWKIKQVIDPDTIVINAPFVADETGNVQNYYDNYNVLVKVYAGLPEYHPSNTEKPMELITDNPITITPQLNNVAVIDVAALVKSKLSLENNYDVNDLNQFTALFISYAEQYDESNGIEVNTVTSAFIDDEIEGCDPGAANFITNGDFSTNLDNWNNLGSGGTWIQDSGSALVELDPNTPGLRESKVLNQSDLGLTDGTQYSISLDYIFPVDKSIIIYVDLGGSGIYEETLSGSGTININNIFNGNETGSFSGISIRVDLVSSSATPEEARIDTIVIVNTSTNPCLAYIFATHSALQPQSKYGANLGEYVQNFNGGVFQNKWLTLMQQPVLFKGNYFDLSTLIPQSVIQSAIQSGGYFLEVVEFDINNEVIAENQYPITQNLGDGIYRFRLDNKTFQDKTKKFTVQILRIPVNLFVDGDQGTFDTTTNPTGNPPSDWNLEKDSRSIINFENTDVYEGTGALSFQSRSIFNDNYALAITNSNQAFENTDIQGAYVTGVDFSGDFTVEIRHRFDEFTSPSHPLFTFNFNGAFFRVIYLGLTSILFQYLFDRSLSGGASRKNIAATITANQFNHFVVSFSPNNFARFYVNGSLIGEILGADAIIDAIDFNYQDGGLLIGADNNRYNPKGYCTGFRIYEGQAATGTEVTSLYNSNRKYPQSIPLSLSGSLVREYLLNQEQSRIVNDSSPNNENATLLDGYSNDQVAFNGGAWVDVSAIN